MKGEEFLKGAEEFVGCFYMGGRRMRLHKDLVLALAAWVPLTGRKTVCHYGK